MYLELYLPLCGTDYVVGKQVVWFFILKLTKDKAKETFVVED